MYAFVKSDPVTSVQYLTAQQEHARRRDGSSARRVRPDAVPGMSLHWPPTLAPTRDDPGCGYVAAFNRHIDQRGADLRKGSALGLHMLVCVSQEWIRETGGLHDEDNPRVPALLRAAVDWAQGWSGGGVWAARMDLDERGGGVVDIFVSPIEEQRHKSGRKVKPVVSVNKAVERLSLQHHNRRASHRAALNTDWALYAQEHLDPRLQRGRPQRETGAGSSPIDAIRRSMQREATALKAILKEVRDGTLGTKDGRVVAADLSAFDGTEAWRALRVDALHYARQRAATLSGLRCVRDVLVRLEDDEAARWAAHELRKGLAEVTAPAP